MVLALDVYHGNVADFTEKIAQHEAVASASPSLDVFTGPCTLQELYVDNTDALATDVTVRLVDRLTHSMSTDRFDWAFRVLANFKGPIRPGWTVTPSTGVVTPGLAFTNGLTLAVTKGIGELDQTPPDNTVTVEIRATT